MVSLHPPPNFHWLYPAARIPSFIKEADMGPGPPPLPPQLLGLCSLPGEKREPV